MDVSDSLANRIEIFKNSARLLWSPNELFTANSWTQVMIGQGIMPSGYHPVADLMSSEELRRYLMGYRQTILNFVDALPEHGDFLMSYCKG